MNHTEALKPYAAGIVDLLMGLVKKENEDNVTLCMKTIMDLERHQPEATAAMVQPFLDLILELFESMEQVVKDTFDTSAQPNTGNATTGKPSSFQSPRPGSPTSSSATSTELDLAPSTGQHLQKGMQSFKVFAECPIIVVSIFQAHRNCVPNNVKKFVPLIKKVLLLQAGPQERAHKEAEERHEIFIGVCKEIKNRHAFGDLITAQVKMMSFLAYLLRVYASQLQDFLKILPSIVVRLLRDCPSEKSATRKELLVAIRHTINFNFRKIFLERIDDLLDERTLLGDGLTVYESMRPLAYSLLADLIHHVRDSLKPHQIRKTVEVFSKNLHDGFPGTSFQTMSAKLLLNLADVIAHLSNKNDARHFLIDILSAIAEKFADMNRQYQNAQKLSKNIDSSSIDSVAEEYLADANSPPDWDEVDIFSATPIKLANPKDRGANPLDDNRFLFRNLLSGLKGMFYHIKMCNPEPPKIDATASPANWPEVSYGFNSEQVDVIRKLFREGARVFRYYTLDKPWMETNSPVDFLTSNYGVQSGKEEKELLETFATVFHSIDPATFYEVFHAEIPVLYDMLFEHPPLLHIAQFFLASEATSPAFAGMLLQFLMDKIGEIGTSDMHKSSILLRLFKLSFMAVTLFSLQNESVLLPHVTDIVTQSIQLSTTAEEPMNYFYLLRSLFRSIGGGRFEHLYKEILPLLEMLLEVLNSLLTAARKTQERDLYVELCLTVPARLSNLLPHLSYLMKPLVVALRAGSDLVGQGLRTLELCVDNLTAEYLDPIMAPVIEDLMQALWNHLKPTPYSHFHSHTTMRILGKLGGRNRKFLHGPPELIYQPFVDEAGTFDIRLTGSGKDRRFPSKIGIDTALAKLSDVAKSSQAKDDLFYKQQAFRMIAAQLKMHVGHGQLPDDFAQVVRLQITDFVEDKVAFSKDEVLASDREKSMPNKEIQQSTLKNLIKACILATTIPELEAQATMMLKDTCRHFTIIEFGKACLQAKQDKKGFDVKSGEGPLYLDSGVLSDALAESLSSENPSIRDASESAIKEIYESAITILGSAEHVEKFPFFGHFAKVLCHQCYEEVWYSKAGGALGIEILATKIGLKDDWVVERQMELVRSLMVVVKDMPQDLPAHTRSRALSTLEAVLKRCVMHASKEDLGSEKNTLEKKTPFYQLCEFIVLELKEMNKHVRFGAHKALTVIGETVGIEVYEIVTPFKGPLLKQIYNKPLRALPFPLQIAYIDAVTYCMGLQHDVVEIDEACNRLLMEALALADASDESLASKPGEYKTAESIVDLRVSCIKILALSLNGPDLTPSGQPSTRGRIISVFFKLLYSPSKKVIDAANTALKGVLAQTNKLPRDLLQNGLRPILMNLQDPKKLSEAGLEGLARLLALLTNYFKTEIGEKLLGHMNIIADSLVLQKASFSLIEQNPQMKILLAGFNIFHLLPPQVLAFMKDLIEKVLNIEAALRRTQYSPFRKPLLRYINRYPKESWEFFCERLGEFKFGRFFGQILTDPRCGPLREAIIADSDKLAKAPSSIEAVPQKAISMINVIHAVYSMNEQMPEWLAAQKPLRRTLMQFGTYLNEKRAGDELTPDIRLAVDIALDQLLQIMVRYLELLPGDVDFLFELFSAVTAEQFRSQLCLYDFIYEKILLDEDIEYWRKLVVRCFEVYNSRSEPPKMKTYVMRNIVNPILAMDTWRGFQGSPEHAGKRRLIDKSLMDTIHNKIWRPQLIEPLDESSQIGSDHTRLEMLEMSALLLKYHPAMVADARKDLIKVGWALIRLEDIINKHATYVMIGYFIAQFDTPVKIINQIYVALLKAHQNEGRALVNQALDLIAPVLKKRLGPQNEPWYPSWAKWPKRVLSEESSNLQQLISIFQFMVRHPHLFYEAREHFVSHIIPQLSKIAQLPNPSNEHKRLVLNLIQMILGWEERRMKGDTQPSQGFDGSPAKLRKAEMPGSGTASPAPASLQISHEKGDYQIPAALRTILMKYLIQFISVLPERYPVPSMKLRELQPNSANSSLLPNEMPKKALGLFYDLLRPDYWSDLELDVFSRVTEPILNSDKNEKPDEKRVTNIVNALQIVRVVLNTKSDDWILSQLPLIQKLLSKVLKSEHPEVQDSIHVSDEELDGKRKISPLLQRVLRIIPQENKEEEDMEVETPGTEFLKFISDTVNSTMGDNNLVAAINLCSTIALARPQDIDPHIPLIMRALQGKLAKDQVQPQVPTPNAPNARSGETPAVLDARERELATQLCLKAIDIVSSRMSNLGDSRRPFLSVLASLVERSANDEICDKILDMVNTWVFDSVEPFPTLKEKTAVLHKMLLFESRPKPALLHKFLNLVIRIYEDSKITRTELSVRLEHAFLIGTRAQDVEMRNRFMTVFDRSLTRTASARLMYILTSQNWDTLAETFWLSQAIQLIFGAVDMTLPIQPHEEDFTTAPPSFYFGAYANDSRKSDVIIDDKLEELITQHQRFYAGLNDVKSRDILEPLCQIQHLDSNLAYEIWVALFPICWSVISRDDRSELEKGIISLLTKDFHQRQLDRRPNVVQAIVEGNMRSRPRCKIPSHVLKFLAKTYDVWYTAAISLEEQAISPPPEIDTPTIRESTLDALAENYANLQEEDFFYGTWRRRCKFVETNAALSFEQMGIWDKAQTLYESAQIKARTGVVPFAQAEYMIWEDHWVHCAQKLQQWDVLSDFSKHENFQDLLLEASWRTMDTWAGHENVEQLSTVIKSVSDAPTPRRAFFQSFISLLKFHDKTEVAAEFERVVNEAIQLSIRKWHQLPRRITNAHVPILQNFQQLIELHDANVICTSLSQTNTSNLDQKSAELKLLLGTWRDRLPNIWDDINAWQDLVTWRQHIFQLINRTYLGLIGPQQTNATGNSYAYRGYHETAWIINRFAHVARKHQLPDVCVAQLGRIYTLPNIEIQEAFLKLREQAKCHYQNVNELNSGLDVINNTNLSYFGNQQKAEFFTLKGMFLAKLQHSNEANDAFGTALYYDLRLPKAWAEWGFYSDMKFKNDPSDMESASAAISCYLEAAGLYKNHKSRKLLSRILWLLSIDNAESKIASAFDEFKGEWPVWYWITFIPQLLTSLGHREARLARTILMRISKFYPQSLYFSLRTTREDLAVIKKAQDDKRRKAEREKAQQSAANGKQASPDTASAAASDKQGTPSRPGTANGESLQNGVDGPKPNVNGTSPPNNNADSENANKQPWEHAEDIMAALKTTFPLLALSMETMVDQIQKNFKCPPDEDAYRLIVALLNDGLSVSQKTFAARDPAEQAQYIARSHSTNTGPDFKLPPATEANIRRFAETILPAHIRRSFEEDFVIKKPTMFEYIHKLRKWRDKFEEKLDRRPQTASLESYSLHLSEFKFRKFDDIEVPGQYLQHRDKNQDFIRIERFLPDVDLVRTCGFSHRRLKLRGHDGSVHPFAVQHPAARHSRREERTLQLFRIFNTVLSKRKESRRRNLQFHLPLIQPLAPSIRLVQDDPSYISLQGIYEDHSRRANRSRDEPIIFAMDRLRNVLVQSQTEITTALRVEIYSAIRSKWCPGDIVLQYFQATYPSYADFFLFRRQFSYQMASLTFITYIMYMSVRYPNKLVISRSTGNIWGSELIPALVHHRPLFHNPEPVPFRLTPNLQTLMGPIATEGLFATSLMAIARCLTEVHHEPGNDLEQQLSIFVRDEMIFWFTSQHKQGPWETQLRETVQSNSEAIVKRAVSLARPPDGFLPANQTAIDLIARATDPKILALCEALWMPWL